MPEYDGIDTSEVINVKKRNASKESDIFHNQYFNDIGFKKSQSFAMAVMV